MSRFPPLALILTLGACAAHPPPDLPPGTLPHRLPEGSGFAASFAWKPDYVAHCLRDWIRVGIPRDFGPITRFEIAPVVQDFVLVAGDGVLVIRGAEGGRGTLIRVDMTPGPESAAQVLHREIAACGGAILDL